MATTLTISAADAKVVWGYSTSFNWGPASNNSSYSYHNTFAQGTGAGQADTIYVANGTIAASGNVVWNLTATLLDMFGNTITFARLKTIYLTVTTDTLASSGTLEGNSTHPYTAYLIGTTPGVIVRNGGVFFITCGAADTTGYAAVASTTDQLKLLNNDSVNTLTYDLVLVGCSA